MLRLLRCGRSLFRSFMASSDSVFPSFYSPMDLLLPRRQAVPALPLLQPPLGPPLARLATSSPKRRRSHPRSTSRCSSSTRVTRRIPQQSSTMRRWRSTTSSKGTLATGNHRHSLWLQHPQRLRRSSMRVPMRMALLRRAATAASRRRRATPARRTIRGTEARTGLDRRKGSMAICRLRLGCNSSSIDRVHATRRMGFRPAPLFLVRCHPLRALLGSCEPIAKQM